MQGWSDYAQEKYDIARNAYMSWLYAGKPRSGFYHYTMCKTRSSTVAEILIGTYIRLTQQYDLGDLE